MHAKNLLIYQGGYGETIETVSECLPELDIVPALAFIIETVDAVDGGTLMISSEQEKVLWVLNFVSQEKTHGLERLLASVNVISQEEVVGIGRETAIFEKSEQVIVLAMNIT